MELFEAIAARHSYRGPFKDQPIPRADLLRIVQAGLQAPSGCNAQTTTFIVVDEPALVSNINAMHRRNAAMQQARAYILCLVDRSPEAVYEGYNFQVEDCAAAVENMLLAVTALGYAAVWVDGWLRIDQHAEAIGELVGLPESKLLRIILPLGIPEEKWKQRDRKPLAERAWFNRFGEEGVR